MFSKYYDRPRHFAQNTQPIDHEGREIDFGQRQRIMTHRPGPEVFEDWEKEAGLQQIKRLRFGVRHRNRCDTLGGTRFKCHCCGPCK